MAKRFTDSVKWEKFWFRKLKPEYKCFWMYILDKCNHIGIWEVDFELAEIYIGASLNIQEIKTIFKEQYIELKDGRQWFIKKFITFQYGDVLTIYNPAVKNVIKELKRLKLDTFFEITESPIEAPSKGLKRGLNAPKEKEKEKEKNKDKDIYKEWEYTFIDKWNSFCNKNPALPKIRSVTPERRVKMKLRWGNSAFRDIDAILTAIQEQPFLYGHNKTEWKISVDWLIANDTNYMKVLERRYKQPERTGISKFLE